MDPQQQLDQEWNVQDLATMVSALSKGEGRSVHEALRRLADVIEQQELVAQEGWTALPLAVTTAAIGQTMPALALFDRLTAALARQAGQEPGIVARVLAKLCRYHLSGPHLEAGRRLLEALGQTGFAPGSRRIRDGLLWSTTLLHFASQQESVDSGMAEAFRQAWRYYLRCPVDEASADADEMPCQDQWQTHWSAAYWQSGPESQRAQPARAGAGTTTVSHLQSTVFAQLQQQMPGHRLELEVQIDHFPVDILIDGCVCVEVDGPDHFFQTAVAAGGEEAGEWVRTDRTKDRFIDHMLRQYGYRIFRVAYDMDPASFRAMVEQIRAAVADSHDSPLLRSRQADDARPYLPATAAAIGPRLPDLPDSSDASASEDSEELIQESV